MVFGRSTGDFAPIISLWTLNGSNGFRLNGVAHFDSRGYAVSGVGDINADGIDDFIIGSDLTDPNGLPNAGSSYLVFGNNDAIFQDGFGTGM